MVATGFHPGELAVQRQAGVTAQAARLVGMLDEPDLSGGGRRFLAERTFAVLTGRDASGLLWTSPLLGPPGFLDVAGATTLDVRAALRPDDPLAVIVAGQPVGLIAIDLSTRRRLRVNGTLTRADAGGLRIEVEEAYGNCPQYIQQRRLEPSVPAAAASAPTLIGSELTADQVRLVRASDTFFLGTTHPDRGVDSSHRGGPAGFVRLEGATLWWPDYPGNNMFNSLGNLAVDPSASLLFLDFASGRTVHLSGVAEVEWASREQPGDDGGTGRRVRFMPRRIVAPATALPVHAESVNPSPYNPPLTG